MTMSSLSSSSNQMLGMMGMGMDPKRRASLKKKARRDKKRPKKRDKYNGYDVPPQEKDDFDLSDPSLTVKRKEKSRKLEDGLIMPGEQQQQQQQQQAASFVIPGKGSKNHGNGGGSSNNSNSSSKLLCHIPQTDKEEAKVARILNLRQPKHDNNNHQQHPHDPSSIQPFSAQVLKKAKTEGRRENESMTAFKKRIESETQEALIKSQLLNSRKLKMNPEKAAKKREYLQKRKLLKKGRRRAKKQSYSSTTSMEDDDNDDDMMNDTVTDNEMNNGFVTGENAAAASLSQMSVGLSEQVERPPVFHVLPRGAKPKAKKLLKTGNESGNTMNEEQKAREQRAMEMMREKVIASYALMKAKRRSR